VSGHHAVCVILLKGLRPGWRLNRANANLQDRVMTGHPVIHLALRPPNAPSQPDTSLGGYFTDGINLYRFLGWVDGSDHRTLAAVEDCRSLEVLLVSRN
jgi:hypothetical protein